MHLPQIVADLKYRRKIAEKFFSVNLRAFDQRNPREKHDNKKPTVAVGLFL